MKGVEIIAPTQHAAFKTFKESENQNNAFKALKGYYSKYYSIMHDRIMKFMQELNGVFIRLLQSQAEKGLSIINLPWCLTEIIGGSLNSDKLVEHIIGIISSVKPLSNTEKASAMFKSAAAEHGITDADFFKTPNYFDCCSIENIDWGEKTIQPLLRNWPVLIMANGCSVNVLAGTKLTELCWVYYYHQM